MRRIASILLVAVLLLCLTACGGQDPVVKPEDTAQQEPLTYTELPTALTAVQVGTISRQGIAAEGGLYYKEGDKYGIMSFDGRYDSGAIYALCQPRGAYFLVGIKAEAESDDVTEYNRIGIVDGKGNELVPMAYASVELLGERFARASEVTRITENEEEKLTYYMDGDKKVLCVGNWYIYDLQTGERLPDATGTKPYIAFDCGGYVKYVKDDDSVFTTLSDGTVISNDVIHLQNGHYADPAKNTVYDTDGNELFTYDPDGYIPCDSKDVNGYIVAKKKVKDKEVYVLLDEEGNVVSAEFATRPVVHGQLLFADKKLVRFDGTPVIDGEYLLSHWEKKYGQLWVLDNGKNRKAVDKDGNLIYQGNTTAPVLDLNMKMCYTNGESQRNYYSVKDKNFNITGVALSPFIVKASDGATSYKLVNTLSGETILSGHMNYTVASPNNSLLYVYAQVSDTEIAVYVVK